MNNKSDCDTAKLRPELQQAYEQLDNSGNYFAYVLCPTQDKSAWEVTTRSGVIYGVLDGRYSDPEQATAAGAAWLQEQLAREPTDNAVFDQQLWKVGANTQP